MVLMVIMVFWTGVVLLRYFADGASLRAGTLFLVILGVSLVISRYCAHYAGELVTIWYVDGWKAYASGLRIQELTRGRLILTDGQVFGRDVHDVWTAAFLGCLIVVGLVLARTMFYGVKKYNPDWAAELLEYVKRNPSRGR